jgi:hypothetical protein
VPFAVDEHPVGALGSRGAPISRRNDIVGETPTAARGKSLAFQVAT